MRSAEHAGRIARSGHGVTPPVSALVRVPNITWLRLRPRHRYAWKGSRHLGRGTPRTGRIRAVALIGEGRGQPSVLRVTPPVSILVRVPIITWLRLQPRERNAWKGSRHLGRGTPRTGRIRAVALIGEGRGQPSVLRVTPPVSALVRIPKNHVASDRCRDYGTQGRPVAV